MMNILLMNPMRCFVYPPISVHKNVYRIGRITYLYDFFNYNVHEVLWSSFILSWLY